MRKAASVVMLVMLVCLEVPAAQAAVTQIAPVYNPRAIYGGPFGPYEIYYRNPGSTFWQLGFSKQLYALTCRPALSSFQSSGTWQGHLNSNGSCADPAEPADWALGNRLNFDGVPAVRKR